MAKLDSRGFVDDGTDDLQVNDNLTVIGNLVVADTSSLSNMLATTVYDIKQKSSGYTITSNDYTIECTSGTFNITLPTAVGRTGAVFNIKNSGSGTITVNTTSSQTIDGQSSGQLSQYDCLTVQSNGSNWIIL